MTGYAMHFFILGVPNSIHVYHRKKLTIGSFNKLHVYLITYIVCHSHHYYYCCMNCTQLLSKLIVEDDYIMMSNNVFMAIQLDKSV